MKLSKNHYMQFAVFFIPCGSFFYVGVPALSLTFLFTFFSIPLILKYRIMEKKEDAILVINFFYLIILGGVAVFLYPTYENFQYFASYITIMLMFFLFLIIRRQCIPINLSVNLFTIFVFVVGLLQFTYLQFGFGLNPQLASLDGYDVNVDNYGVCSIFSNPNDFSVMLVLVTLYYFIKRKTNFLIMCGIFIFLSGSRTCLVVYFVLFVLYFINKVTVKSILSLIVVLVAIFLIYYFYIRTNLDFYSVRRFLNLFNGVQDDGSIASRSEAASGFYHHFWSLMFGGWEAKKYDIYSDSSLFYVNPHSFIFEILLLYGFYGMIFLFNLFLGCWILLSKFKISKFSQIFFGFTIVTITFVPSSILNFPSFWAVLFLVLLSNEPQRLKNV